MLKQYTEGQDGNSIGIYFERKRSKKRLTNFIINVKSRIIANESGFGGYMVHIIFDSSHVLIPLYDKFLRNDNLLREGVLEHISQCTNHAVVLLIKATQVTEVIMAQVSTMETLTLKRVSLIQYVGVNLECKTPYFCTNHSKYRLVPHATKSFQSKYNHNGYYFCPEYFSKATQISVPHFAKLDTQQATDDDFKEYLSNIFNAFGTIGLYTVAKGAQVLHASKVRCICDQICSVFLYGPKNSGKSLLQKSYLCMVGLMSTQLKEGSSTESALLSTMAAMKGMMLCVEDPRKVDHNGNLLSPTLLHLCYQASTQFTVKYGNRQAESILFVTTNDFPFAVCQDGSSDATISRGLFWKTYVAEPSVESLNAIKQTMDTPGKYLQRLWHLGSDFQANCSDHFIQEFQALCETEGLTAAAASHRTICDFANDAWWLQKVLAIYTAGTNINGQQMLRDFFKRCLSTIDMHLSRPNGEPPVSLNSLSTRIEQVFAACIQSNSMVENKHFAMVHHQEKHWLAVQISTVLPLIQNPPQAVLAVDKVMFTRFMMSVPTKIIRGVNTNCWDDGKQHKAVLFACDAFPGTMLDHLFPPAQHQDAAIAIIAQDYNEDVTDSEDEYHGNG